MDQGGEIELPDAMDVVITAAAIIGDDEDVESTDRRRMPPPARREPRSGLGLKRKRVLAPVSAKAKGTAVRIQSSASSASCDAGKPLESKEDWATLYVREDGSASTAPMATSAPVQRLTPNFVDLLQRIVYDIKIVPMVHAGPPVGAPGSPQCFDHIASADDVTDTHRVWLCGSLAMAHIWLDVNRWFVVLQNWVHYDHKWPPEVDRDRLGEMKMDVARRLVARISEHRPPCIVKLRRLANADLVIILDWYPARLQPAGGDLPGQEVILPCHDSSGTRPV
jgi:hypothetical protein